MTVHLDMHGAVGVITLDRPDALHALDLAALAGLRWQLAACRDRDDVRAIVLTGSGTKAFCVGADLKATAASPASYPEAMLRTADRAAEQGLYIRAMDLSALELWKPMIAAINGHCLGGGLELALQCDIRIASTNASFGLPEVAVASIPAVSGLHRLLKAVPATHAMQMALTGERIAADHAARIGLVSEITAPDDLLTRALAIAERIASNGPLAVQALKRLSRQTAHLSDADAQLLTELHWGALRETEDRREGRAAFAEKRAPHYAGR